MLQPIKSNLHHYRSRILLVAAAAFIIGIILFILGSPMETRLVALDARNGRLRWIDEPGGRVKALGAPVACNGRVFLSQEIESAPGELYSPRFWKLTALDSASGKNLWEFIPDEDQFGPLATTISRMYQPVATDNSVYVAIVNTHGQTWLVTLDASSGEVRWAIEGLWFSRYDFSTLTNLLTVSVRYPGISATRDRVYALFSNSDGQGETISLTALDTHSGNAIWHTDVDIATDKPAETIPSLTSNEQTVILTIGEQANSYAAETGEFQKTFPGGIVSVTGSVIYSNPDRSLTASDITTGELYWTYQWPEDVLACTFFNADAQSVYVVCSFKTSEEYPALVALDAQKGTERWQTPISKNLFPVLTQAPIIGVDKVFVVGGSIPVPAVMAITSNDGSSRWMYSIYDGIKSVAFENNRVYVVEISPRWRNWLAYLSPALH